MQDRYLFRGKPKKGKKWVYGSPVEYFNNTYIMELTDFKEDRVYEYAPHKELWSHEVDPTTVGQCTGLKDKNEKLIYEGDLVTVTGYSYTEPEIEESGEIDITPLGFALWDEETCRHKDLNDLQGSYSTIYEIYGNIHDKEGEDEV